MYITGYYNGTATIKDQTGASLGTLPVATVAAFLVKFDNSGTYQYGRILDVTGVSTTEHAYGVACDSSNNVYMVGLYNGTPSIKTQSNTVLGTLPTSAGSSAFACKFNSSGTYQYSRIVDSAGTEQGLGVTCDSSGNMYLTGYYNGTPTIKDQAGTSLGTLPADTANAAFVSKFNSSGTYQYSRIVDSAGSDSGNSITCDSSGNMYLAGFYNGTPTIKDQAGTSLGTLPASSGIAAFVSKFDLSGTYQYSRIIDSAGNDEGTSVTCDSSGNMYLTGYYTGTPTIEYQNGTSLASLPTSTAGAAFLIKFDSAGNYLPVAPVYPTFARLIDSAGADQGLGVACDSSGNVYIAGYYTGTPSIRNQYGGTTFGTLPVSSGIAAFVSKFNSSGTYQYSRIVDSAGTDQGLGVACDSSGNMYLTGQYAGTPTIKDQAGTSLGTLPVSSGIAAFVSKFDSSGTYQYSRIVDSAGSDSGNSITCYSSGNM
jgi:hypothetical protein